MLLRNEPNPGREVTSRSEGPGVSNTRNQSGRQHRTDPGNVMKALASLLEPMPGHQHTTKLQHLPLEAEQLIAKRSKARPANRRHPFVARVGNNMQQFGDSFSPDRRDNAELGKVSPDRVNYRGLLADEQMAGAVKHQAALLLGRLCWHKPHVGSRDRFANSLSVSCIVLMTLDVGLHVSRWHQSHGMAKRLKFARPMVRRCARLNANQAGWQFLEERQDRAPLQLAADDHLASGINSVNLEHRLGDVETDCRDRLHRSLSESW